MPLHVHNNSTFLHDNVVINEPDFYTILDEFKNSLATQHIIYTRNQLVLTESDLKCQIYHHLFELVNNNRCKLLTELADKELDFSDNTTIRTDMTIIAHENLIYRDTDIHKGFTLNGKYVDIEIKFVRSGLANENKRNELIRDFEKLTNIIDRGNEPGHGQTLYGLAIIGFQKLSTLVSFLNDQIFVDAMNNFTTQNKKVILLYCQDN